MNDKVRAILAETFHIKADDVTEEMTMESLGSWDSLAHMEMIANLESELEIEFDGDEIVEMVSVTKILEIVARKTR